MFDLKGRVAVVTGASGGLGRQFALALAKQGADIALLARREDKMAEVALEVRALGVKCFCFKTDVTIIDDVKNAAKAVFDEFGKVDILVNNAGGGAAGAMEELPDDAWDHTIKLNLYGTMHCTREFGAKMVEKGYGRIINISSILGAGGLPEIPVSPYHAAKGGQTNFTRAVAAEWAKTGVTVNALCPGFFPSQANSAEAMEQMSGFINARTPMGRAGVDGELDSSIVFLAADESSYVTGVILYCDGGWTCV